MANSKLPTHSDSAQRFVKQLEQTAILSGDEISEAIEGLPPSDPLDAQAIAKALVRERKITKYQAQVAYQGKAKNLKIGDYLVLDRLGEGGMGQVLKAKHQTMDRIVALKVLHRKLTSSESMVKRFQQEVRAAAKLMHPNIVSAFDAGKHNKTHYLVMEFVEGKDLSTIVREEGMLSLADATHCILQAARGLACAHEQGIVHRDVKPANLLLGSDGTLRVLDMGLARMSQEAAGELTRTGQVMGTVDYMAPEQARETKDVDARGDIYSLGCTLYKVLTGEPMYRRDTVVSQVMAHQNDPIPSLIDARPETPVELNRLFQRMVAKDPDDRPQTMMEVVSVLERLDSGGGTSADLSESLKKPSDDNLTEFFAGIDKREANTVASGSTKIISPVAARQKTQRKQQGLAIWLIVGGTLACLMLLLGVVFWLTQPATNKSAVDRDSTPNERDGGDEDVDDGGLNWPKESRPLEFDVLAGDEAPPLSHGLDDVTDMDRHVATCVLKWGGTLDISLLGREPQRVDNLKRLPATKFNVVAATLRDLRPQNEDEWRCLSELPRLTNILVRLDDDDLKMMANRNWPALSKLTAVGDDTLTDEGIETLTTMKKIRVLTLRGGNFSEQGMASLTKMQGLYNLYLVNEQLTPAHFAAVAKHEGLLHLCVDQASFSDQHLAAIMSAKKLATVRLIGTSVTAEGYKVLSRLDTLEGLQIERTPCGDVEAEVLAQHARQLVRLLMPASNLTNKGAESIASLSRLEKLLLWNCEKVTDKGLMHFAELPHLKELDFVGTPKTAAFTEAGIQKLREANSNIVVNRN